VPAFILRQVAGTGRGDKKLAHRDARAGRPPDCRRMGSNPAVFGSRRLRSRLDCQPRARATPSAPRFYVRSARSLSMDIAVKRRSGHPVDRRYALPEGRN
jgi:hypothetical protein